MSDDIIGWRDFIIVCVIIVAIIGGTYFTAAAIYDAVMLTQVNSAPTFTGAQIFQNVFGANGNAALGSALYLAALIGILLTAIPRHLSHQQEHTDLLEQQNAYLRYLVERAQRPRKPTNS